MDWITRELLHALRSLRRNPMFAAIVVATLALGIGGNTLLLGVIKATFFSRLPFPQAGRVLRLEASYRNPDGSISTVTIRGREYNVLEQVTASPVGPFSSMVGLEDVSATLTGVDSPQKLTLIHTTAGWTATLGVQPILGRWFTPTEEQRGEGSGVAVISHELWSTLFGASSTALGRPLTLDGRSYSIIGVLPPGFRFPYDGEVWTPVTTPPDFTRDYAVFARLKPGVTVQAAEAALAIAAQALHKAYADTVSGFGFAQISLMQNLQDDQQGAAIALLGVAGFFLLLACANVANLLLARSVARQREEVIRVALGASGWHRVRRHLIEGVVLSTLGTAAGIAIAAFAGQWLDSLVPSNFVKQLGIRPNPLDSQVLLTAGLVGLLSGVLVGLLPALKNLTIDREWLGRANARDGQTRAERRTMNAFVVLQFTLALALLAGAGLLLQNFSRLVRRDLGFDAARLLSMQVSVSAPRFASPAAKSTLVRNIVREVQAAPGVSAAGISTMNPLGPGSWWAPVVAAGQEESSADSSNMVNHRLVSPDFFRAMGIPLLRGRLLTEQDVSSSGLAVIVSERMGKKFWPNADPVGQRIRINRPGQPWMTVVGVVGNVQDYGGPGSPRETWYLPYAQFSQTAAASSIYLMVQSKADPRSIGHAVEQAVWSVDRDLALFDISTLDRFYLESLSQQRLSAILVAALAFFGLLLGGLGVYGTLSFSVAARVREIGVRMALGANPRDILRLTISQGMRLSLLSALLGMGAAFALGRILSSQLSEIRPADAATLICAAGILCAVALLASYVPARRAASVDPQVALRRD